MLWWLVILTTIPIPIAISFRVQVSIPNIQPLEEHLLAHHVQGHIVWVEGLSAEPPAGSLIARRRAAVRAAEAEAGTEVTIGPENLDALTAFADRSGLSAIADPEARREAAAQKADEITALLSI